MKVPWHSSGSITGNRIEHFQHLDEDAEGETPNESGEEGWLEEADLPTRYPYPLFWEIEEERL